MCGPAGSVFSFGLSIFAVLFLGLLAILISSDYPYVGEWFDPKGSPGQPPQPLNEQRSAAVHSLWMAVAIYGVMAVVAGVAVCTHRIRGAL